MRYNWIYNVKIKYIILNKNYKYNIEHQNW